MDAPKGMIEFSKTSICSETIRPFQQQLYVYASITIISVIFSIYFPLVWIISTVCAIFSYSKLATINFTKSVPLSVNLNHPFMDTEFVSRSEIMVNFSGKWINPGMHLLKLVKDPIHGWMIHKQDKDLSILSSWESKKSEKILTKQLTIINQAISLNNAMNESNDEFEDAREREAQESTLLERNWMPEEEIEIQGPLSKIFSSE